MLLTGDHRRGGFLAILQSVVAVQSALQLVNMLVSLPAEFMCAWQLYTSLICNACAHVLLPL